MPLPISSVYSGELSQTPPLSTQQTVCYWYSGDTKIQLHHHPGLYVLRPRSDISGEGIMNSLQNQGIHQGFQIYQTFDNAALELPVDSPSPFSPLYSSGENWRESTIYVQDPGVLLCFKESQTVEKVNAWLTQQGKEPREVENTQLNYVYQLKDINGLQAVQLANQLFEIDQSQDQPQLKYAQPNWLHNSQSAI